MAALPNNWIPAVDGAGTVAAMAKHHKHYDPAHYLRVSALFDSPFWRDRISLVFHDRRVRRHLRATRAPATPPDARCARLAAGR